MTPPRSLGLRRHTIAPAAIAAPSEPDPYGLHRGLPRRPSGPFRDFGRADVVVDDAPPAAAPEFIEAEPESDILIAGVETIVAPVVPEFVDPHPGFFAYEGGELIPEVGPYTTRDGRRWIDAVPAFLMEDRPVSNIR